MFRFTIRDVLWLMVVVAMACGWWIQVAKHKQVIDLNDWMMDDINSSGVWMDAQNRVLQFRRDRRGQIRIVPYVKDANGNWGPEPAPQMRGSQN